MDPVLGHHTSKEKQPAAVPNLLNDHLYQPPKQGHDEDHTEQTMREWCLSRHHHFIYPLIARVVGAPQMISQPVSSMFPCSPLPSETLRTPGLSIPCCCLPTSSSVCLVFFPLSLCLARWFWPDLMNGRHDHTTAVCISL